MSTREFNFNKTGGKWFYETAPDLGLGAVEMPISTWSLLDFAANGNNEVTLRILRKNTLERVKISLGRAQYMKGGVLYYILDYTGARYGTKDLRRRKLWIGSAMRKILNNFPEVIRCKYRKSSMMCRAAKSPLQCIVRPEGETYHPCLSSESVELKISILLAGIALCFPTVKIVKIIIGGKGLGSCVGSPRQEKFRIFLLGFTKILLAERIFSYIYEP